MSPADRTVGGPAGREDTGDTEDAARRAARLLRWYPKPWRERYGEEFAELLIADIAERPNSPTRTLDVARTGIAARLAGAGLAGFPLATTPGGTGELAAARARQVAASLGSLGAAVAVFLIIAAAQWSQILIGWVWMMRAGTLTHNDNWPSFAAERDLTLGTSAAVIAFLALGALAAIPVLGTVAARLRSPRFDGQRKRLTRPAVTLAAAITALVMGSRALENNWIGTGGLHSPVPGGFAAFIWAATLFVSAYWAHPAQFATLSETERTWMTLSPVVIAVAVASVVVLVRSAALSPRVARFEARVGVACCVVMTAFLAIWVWYYAQAATGQGLFHIGTVNEVSAAVLALALITGLQAARMALRGLRQSSR